MNKKAVIFDLDGTLWDSSREVVISWNIVLERHQLNKITLDDMHGFMGKTLDVIGKIMLPDLDEEGRNKIIEECAVEEHKYRSEHGGQLYDGFTQVIVKLRKEYETYIVSNCQDGYIQTFLEYYDFGKYFDDIEMAGRTNLSKGENIKLIMDRNDINKAIYVGDTSGDMEAARAAGIPFIHASYGFGKVEEADEVAICIKDIPNCVERILK